MNDDIFSGIPSLDDHQGLEQYMDNAQANAFGADSGIPAALQQQEPTPAPAPATEPAPAAQQTPMFTSEQVAQIVARMQQANQPAAQPQTQPQYSRQAQPQAAASGYTPQQAAIIKQLIDRGTPLSVIQNALNGNLPGGAAQRQILDRVQGIEQYLQAQQYKVEESNFINKMTSFGDKFGLSEADLVTFGNQALSMGINLANVTDVEAVFRAVYPEQYAIRSQRIAGAPASQIYGGASAVETPRAASSKLEDAYVDAFLKQAMPNAYTRTK